MVHIVAYLWLPLINSTDLTELVLAALGELYEKNMTGAEKAGRWLHLSEMAV